MSRNGLSLKAKADLLAANIRGTRDLRSGAVGAPRQSLGEQIGAVRPKPRRRTGHVPTTRILDGKGRLRALLGDDRSPLTVVLGCGPGPLAVQADGIWLLLRPAVGATKRRHDGCPTLTADGRLTLPLTVLARLGLGPSSEIALVAAPEIGALAVCNPADLLAAAPPTALDVRFAADDTTVSDGSGGDPR